MAQVLILMGSDSDLEIMNEAGKALDEFGIAYEIDVSSHIARPRAHRRSPRLLPGAASRSSLPVRVAPRTWPES